MKINSLFKTAFSFSLALLCSSIVFAAAAWPTTSSGNNIATGLAAYNSGFEASGLTYHDLYGYLVVGDDGDIGILDSNGNVRDYADIGGDFEGITVVDQSSNYAYIASESQNSILEIDLDTLTLTGNEWELDLSQSGGWGFEGIAFVPEDLAPSAWGTASHLGFFIAGTQNDKSVHVYNIDIRSTGTSTYTSLDSVYTHYNDVAGMHFSPETELLYVVHDSVNKMKEFDLSGTIISSYDTPNAVAEEGVYITPDCKNGVGIIGFTDDGGAKVDLYTNYPISCDQDHDGVDATIDCDDNDPAKGAPITVYLDMDGDKLGDPSTGFEHCNIRPPRLASYNNADSNDNISNWGIEIAGDGVDNDGIDADGDWAPDGDGLIDEENTVAENGMHPHYYGMNPYSTVHFLTIQSVRFDRITKDVLVQFRDNSIYRYNTGMSIGSRYTMTRMPGSAIVQIDNGIRRIRMNLLTGEIL